MRVIIVFIFLLSFSSILFAQQGADTLHYRKVYYFGGTGIAVPVGNIKETLSPSLFSASMGLDVSLNNPNYFVIPTIYMLKFKYNQSLQDPMYNSTVSNGSASIYLLSLAGGIRKQWNRLNTFIYAGPSAAMYVELRADNFNNLTKLDYQYSLSPAAKIGVGADYKFDGFFIGLETGYLYSLRKMQGHSINAVTLMIGLKSDITALKNKVVKVISQ